MSSISFGKVYSISILNFCSISGCHFNINNAVVRVLAEDSWPPTRKAIMSQNTSSLPAFVSESTQNQTLSLSSVFSKNQLKAAKQVHWLEINALFSTPMLKSTRNGKIEWIGLVAYKAWASDIQVIESWASIMIVCFDFAS